MHNPLGAWRWDIIWSFGDSGAIIRDSGIVERPKSNGGGESDLDLEVTRETDICENAWFNDESHTKKIFITPFIYFFDFWKVCIR